MHEGPGGRKDPVATLGGSGVRIRGRRGLRDRLQSHQGDACRWKRTRDASDVGDGTGREEQDVESRHPDEQGRVPHGRVPRHTPFSFPQHRGCIFTTDNMGRMSFFVILNPTIKEKGEWGHGVKEWVPARAWFP